MPSSIARRMRSSSWVSAARIRTKASPFAQLEALGLLAVRGPERLDLALEGPSIRASAASIRRPSSRVNRDAHASRTVRRGRGTSRGAVSRVVGHRRDRASGASSRARSSGLLAPAVPNALVLSGIGAPSGTRHPTAPTASSASSEGEVTTEGWWRRRPRLAAGDGTVDPVPRAHRPSFSMARRPRDGPPGSRSPPARATLGDVRIGTDRRTAGRPIQRPCTTMARRRPRTRRPKGAPDACRDPMPRRRARSSSCSHRRSARTSGEADPARRLRSSRVRIIDFAFRPRNLTIARGTVVRWVNRGGRTHTTTSNTSLWDHTLAPGETFRRRFRQDGDVRLPLL